MAKRISDGGLSILVCIAIIGLIAFATTVRMQAGKPANSIAFLGNQTQELVWKNQQVAVFRSHDGTEKFVEVNTAPLEVGANYRVKENNFLSKAGWLHSFYLKKVKA